MTGELTPAGSSRGRGPLRVFLLIVGGVLAGLMLLAGILVLLFTLRNVKAKRDAQPIFAEMDAAFGRVRLPDGYVVIRSDRQGGYYNLLGYQSPGEYRVHAAPPGPRATDEFKAAIQSAGFSIGQDYACTIIADRGPITLYIEFHATPEGMDITGVDCSPERWPHVYVHVSIMSPPPDGYGT